MNLRRTASLALQLFVGVVVGCVLLWLALRNVDLSQVWRILTLIDRRWIAGAIFVYWIALSLRILRWWIILRAVAAIHLAQVAVALLCGYAINAILPARLGELFRAHFCGRRYRISRTVVFGTIMIERFSDGVIVL